MTDQLLIPPLRMISYRPLNDTTYGKLGLIDAYITFEDRRGERGVVWGCCPVTPSELLNEVVYDRHVASLTGRCPRCKAGINRTQRRLIQRGKVSRPELQHEADCLAGNDRFRELIARLEDDL